MDHEHSHLHNEHESHDHAPVGGAKSQPAPVEGQAHAAMTRNVHEPSGPLEHEAMAHAVHGRGVQREGHAAHVDHAGHEEMFRRRFWICLVLSIPVLLYSDMFQMWLHFSAPAFPGSPFLAPLFSIAIFLYGGLPFLQMAVPELQNRQPGMMTLISLAISVALIYSLAAFVSGAGGGFFWELVTLIDIMLLGHWLEMRSVRQASGALNELAQLMPDTAERIRRDGIIETVRVRQLRVGDMILVRPGDRIAADGQVVEGDSEVDESMMTGESRPAKKEPGSPVVAGTINGEGSLRVRVTATGEQTALAGIMRLVKEAQESKSRTQVLADKAAGWLFYIALAVAVVTAVVWTRALGLNSEVVGRVATVLVIACPHALGLAIPLVVAITTSLGARNGILVRSRLALEQARGVHVVLFDKTGTLTYGKPGVIDLATTGDTNPEQALGWAAAVEGDSEHMIAKGIRDAAQARKVTPPMATQFEALKGRGVRAQVDGQAMYVGGPRLLEKLNIHLPEDLASFTQKAEAKGQTVVYLVREDKPSAAFALADVIRPESKRAVSDLHALGIQVAMVTGDSEAVAKTVAQELGIDQYFAQVLPESKAQMVADLQKQGNRVDARTRPHKGERPNGRVHASVAMVGDGINDAPALARADVGIAIGSGTNVAIESAGIILIQSNPLDVVTLIELSRASYRKMIENLIWAAGYNVVALPLAAGILAPVGILLSPAIGALFMSLSTIVVAVNAQLLRRTPLKA